MLPPARARRCTRAALPDWLSEPKPGAFAGVICLGRGRRNRSTRVKVGPATGTTREIVADSRITSGTDLRPSVFSGSLEILRHRNSSQHVNALGRPQEAEHSVAFSALTQCIRSI